MSRWTECVIDASMGFRNGLFCFCPIEGSILSPDMQIVTGMNMLADKPPRNWKLVGIVHEDGNDAVTAFVEKHKAAIDALDAPVEKE